MSQRRLASALDLVTDSTTGVSFKLGLEAIVSGTGRLVSNPNIEYDGDGIRFQGGDLLFGKLRPYLRKAWLADRPGAAVGDFLVLRPKPGMSGQYLRYLVLSEPVMGSINASVFGAKMPRTDWKTVRNVQGYIPPPDEQRRIADFLDAETARIDTLIAEQERFIQLLSERRSAELDRKIPLVGVSAWPTDKLGRWADVRSGSTPRRDNDAYWRDDGFPWLSSAAVNLPSVNSAEEFVTEKAVRECSLPIVEPGSLLIGLIGQGPTRGLTTITRIKSALSQNLAYIAPDRSRWLPEYLLWSLRASYQEIRQRGAESGAAQGMLNTDDIRRYRLVRPPMNEQRRIVKELESATARIDGLIAEAERNIALSKERRAALITAAVTGQIDASTGRAA